MSKVYLLGAGPGDPGLLTLRAKEILEKADVVVYDALANASFLDFASPDACRASLRPSPLPPTRASR